MKRACYRLLNISSLLAFPLAAALLFAGCDMLHGFPPPDGAPDASVVHVKLDEFDIHMPTSLPAGATTFQVTNIGNTAHNFEVEGQGIEREFESHLEPGATKPLEVDLQPGTYVIYCPVDNHRELGMELTEEVHPTGSEAAAHNHKAMSMKLTVRSQPSGRGLFSVFPF